MQKKYSFLLIIAVTFTIAFGFISCGDKSENYDQIAPQISDVRFNLQDTIMKGDVLFTIINPKTTTTEDTLIIGKVVYLNAHFSTKNENALSSYKVELYVDTKSAKDSIRKDTLFAVSAKIAGQTEITIEKNRLMLIPDSVNVRNQTGSTLYGPVEGRYKMMIEYGDIYGNRDTTYRDINLLKRITLENAKLK